MLLPEKITSEWKIVPSVTFFIVGFGDTPIIELSGTEKHFGGGDTIRR